MRTNRLGRYHPSRVPASARVIGAVSVPERAGHEAGCFGRWCSCGRGGCGGSKHRQDRGDDEGGSGVDGHYGGEYNCGEVGDCVDVSRLSLDDWRESISDVVACGAVDSVGRGTGGIGSGGGRERQRRVGEEQGGCCFGNVDGRFGFGQRVSCGGIENGRQHMGGREGVKDGHEGGDHGCGFVSDRVGVGAGNRGGVGRLSLYHWGEGIGRPDGDNGDADAVGASLGNAIGARSSLGRGSGGRGSGVGGSGAGHIGDVEDGDQLGGRRDDDGREDGLGGDVGCIVIMLGLMSRGGDNSAVDEGGRQVR